MAWVGDSPPRRPRARCPRPRTPRRPRPGRRRRRTARARGSRAPGRRTRCRPARPRRRRSGRCRCRRSRAARSPTVATISDLAVAGQPVPDQLTGWPGSRYSVSKMSRISLGEPPRRPESVTLLDDPGELRSAAAAAGPVVLGLHDVGDAALAGLRVDPDHGLVGAPEVLGVDRAGRAPPTGGRPATPAAAASRLQRSKPFLMASWCEPENAV